MHIENHKYFHFIVNVFKKQMCMHECVQWYVLAIDKINSVYIKQIIILLCVYSTLPQTCQMFLKQSILF